jgi:uncharacterized membrane protein
MSLAEFYPWLKALHVASAVVFAGGVLAVSVFLAAVPANAESSSSIARAVRRWDQTVATPAMLLVWTFGLALAIAGHWFSEAWLQAKLAVVLALSGVHGVQSGQLRRLACGDDVRSSRSPSMILVCIIVIAGLAVVKP